MSDRISSPQPFAERLSDWLQDAIKAVIGSNRKPPRRLKSLLNGTWFGHPLHPVITDVPITAWLLTAIFDILWLISPARNTWAALGAFVAVTVGLLRESLNVFIDAGVGLVGTHIMMIPRIKVLLLG